MAIINEKQRLNLAADELISVSVDASELSVASAEPLRTILSRYGRPVSARAFADFQQSSLSDLAVQLYQMGFTLVHCPTWPNGDGTPKPIVSDIMAQDLRDQLEQLDDDVETYILVATSREYIAVANSLRRHERRVVVVAEETKACRELRLCADEFVALPPTRPERASEPARSRRSVETARVERVSEVARTEKPAEAVTAEPAPAPVRVERSARGSRAARPAEPVRSVEPVRPAEPARAERAEAADQLRLPSDVEVLAEVRRIVAAEGICTPRRLARALCPVDRTPTGELRSRIANRIQSLIDAGKLQRERLVVGGTSVETILVREERGEKPSAATPESASVPTPAQAPTPTSKGGTLPPGVFALESVVASSVVPEVPAELPTTDYGKSGGSAARDLDAFVESVLRGPELAVGPTPENGERKEEPVAAEVAPAFVTQPVAESQPEANSEPAVAAFEESPAAEKPAEAGEPVVAVEAAPAEPVKRPRTRRRSSPKKAAAAAEAVETAQQ